MSSVDTTERKGDIGVKWFKILLKTIMTSNIIRNEKENLENVNSFSPEPGFLECQPSITLECRLDITPWLINNSIFFHPGYSFSNLPFLFHLCTYAVLMLTYVLMYLDFFLIYHIFTCDL